jgi:hypothetical protein
LLPKEPIKVQLPFLIQSTPLIKLNLPWFLGQYENKYKITIPSLVAQGANKSTTTSADAVKSSKNYTFLGSLVNVTIKQFYLFLH